MKGKLNAKYIAECGLLLSLAVTASYVEMLIPLNIAIPGIKAGIANCVILFILYRHGFLQAVLISLLRTVITAFLFSGPFAFVYSFSGALVSILQMNVLKKSSIFSIYGVSIAGGVSHNLTQLLAASFVLTASGSGIRYLMTYYLPVLILAGMAAGCLNALIADTLIKRIPDKRKQEG